MPNEQEKFFSNYTGADLDASIARSKAVTATDAELNYSRGLTGNIQTQINAKQDQLTAGENITIENNVISATGGGNVADVLVNDESVVDPETKIANIELSEGEVDITLTQTSISDGTVTLDISGKQDQLTAGENITIENNVISANGGGLVDDVKVDGESVVTNKVANIDLSGKQDTLTAGENITIEQRSSVLPAKGAIITLELGGTTPVAGQANTYRVLSIDENNVARLMAMFSVGTASTSINSKYANSTIDTTVNTTFYNALTQRAKEAIIDTNFTIHNYTSNSAVYNKDTHSSYYDYSTETSKEAVGDRHIVTPQVKDIEEYFSYAFSRQDLYELFTGNREIASGYDVRISDTTLDGSYRFTIAKYNSFDKTYYIDSGTNAGNIIPVFDIDLTDFYKPQTVISATGGGEPDAYIKNASVSDNTLTLTKKDDTTVTFEDHDTTYTAGTGIDITNNVISATSSGGFDPTDKTNAMTSAGFNYGRKSGTTVGSNSVALGYNVTASGSCAFAEGQNTTASGGYGSHAEGYNTTAEALYSHAEGSSTYAQDAASHAEGSNTTASGNSAHAEGRDTLASSMCSHAEGQGTKATAASQHVQGKYNLTDTSKAFIIGNGTDNNNRSNAMTVDWNGIIQASGLTDGTTTKTMSEVLAGGGGGFDPTISTNEMTAAGFNYGRKSGTTVGDYSVALGYNVTASGSYSHAEGRGTTASGGYGAHAEGYNTTASALRAHAEGEATTASGINAHAEGEGTIASARNQHVQGKYNVDDNTKAFIIGNGDESTRRNALTVDWSGNVNASGNIQAAGLTDGTTTKTMTEVLAGGGTQVSGTNDGTNWTTITIDDDTYAIPQGGSGGGFDPTKATNAMTSAGFNYGRKSGTTVGDYSVALGYNVTASGYYSHAEGNWTTAEGNYSHAEGFLTNATNSYSHAEGYQTTASQASSHAEGQGTIASGQYSHAEGCNSTAKGSYTHAEGYNATALGAGAHSEGKSSNIAPTSLTASSGLAAVLSGWNSSKFSLAQCDSSHNEGQDTLAVGKYAHAEGYRTIAASLYSTNPNDGDGATHAEGYRTTAGSNGAHAEGYSSNTFPSTLTPESSNTDIINAWNSTKFTLARGGNNKFEQAPAHAEGQDTLALGKWSHAEGCNTIASGYYSHAEGSYTTASSSYSHAEGSYTTASNAYAHAEGDHTIASGMRQHVQGKYNAEDTNKAFIIGNGTDNNNRSNALTVDWNGVVDAAGGFAYMTEAPTAANTSGGLKLVILNAEPATRYAGYLYIITE